METIKTTIDPIWHLNAVKESCCDCCNVKKCKTCDAFEWKKWLKALHEKGNFFESTEVVYDKPNQGRGRNRKKHLSRGRRR